VPAYKVPLSTTEKKDAHVHRVWWVSDHPKILVEYSQIVAEYQREGENWGVAVGWEAVATRQKQIEKAFRKGDVVTAALACRRTLRENGRQTVDYSESLRSYTSLLDSAPGVGLPVVSCSR